MGLIARMFGYDGSAQERVQDEMLQRDVEPLEGTNMSLWNSQIPEWWSENMGTPGMSFFPGNGLLSQRVWVANRCIQMNSQQIAAMPLRYEAPNVVDASEPAWCSSPDPHWFPNGLSDAVLAMVADIYGWGFTILYITDTYANGYPRTWTVLPAQRMMITWNEYGVSRSYSMGGTQLESSRIVQIDRDPGGIKLHGTPALRAFAMQAYGLLAAGEQSMSVSQGGVPTAVLKSPTRTFTAAQARDLQAQWMDAVQRRHGAPPVLGKDLDFAALSFNPQELGLLEVQDFNAKAIATAYGVPAVLLNMAIRWGMTYQNPAALGEMWWRFELRPMAKRIADALTSQMLPSGQWVWFDAADTFMPLSNDTSLVATESDDPQAAAVAHDSQQVQPATAQASPAQQYGNDPAASALAAINGGGMG